MEQVLRLKLNLKLKLSIIFPVLESYDVVVRQLLHFSSFLVKDEFKDVVELIIVDDNSSPSIFEYLSSKNLFPQNSITSLPDPQTRVINLGFRFVIFETNDPRLWAQPAARNSGAKIALGEILYLSDIDHILTEDSVRECLSKSFDKMEFRRSWGVLDENGNILTKDLGIMIDYGLKVEDFGKSSVHANTFAMKASIFKELGGYDAKFVGKYAGDDTDFNRRYGQLHYSGKVARSIIASSLIYVYPDPRKDIKNIFHYIRRGGRKNKCQ